MQITLWTDEQVVKETGDAVSVGTLRNWRWSRRGGPPFVKIGKLVRYRPEDVKQWIDSQIVRPVDTRHGKAGEGR